MPRLTKQMLTDLERKVANLEAQITEGRGVNKRLEASATSAREAQSLAERRASDAERRAAHLEEQMLEWRDRCNNAEGKLEIARAIAFPGASAF